MTQDRRKFRRIKTSHPAQLILSDSTTTDCLINNYSRGGFSLAIEEGALNAIQRDVPLDAVVLLKPGKEREDYRIPVRIVFASDSSIGAAFMELDQRVLGYLSRLALNDRSPSGDSRQTPALRALYEVQSLLDQSLISRFDGFARILDETFLELEEHASQQAQPELRHGRLAIEAAPGELRERFLLQVNENWRQLQYAEVNTDLSRPDSQHLELVNRDEFDEWAAVVATSRRLESRFSQTLYALSQAIAYILKSPVSNDNNPLSPYCLLWAFKKSLDPLQLSVESRRIAYRVFAEQILATLDPLYHQLYQLLEQRGYGVTEQKPSPLEPVSSRQDEAEQAGRPQRPRPRSLIERLSSYVGRKKEPPAPGTMAQGIASSTAVTHALDDMVQGDQRNLADRVEQALGGHTGAEGDVELSGQSRQIIDATEQLLRMAQQDPRHNSTMRRILRQVQLPLARAAIENPAVLNDSSHPAHKLLDDLDQLALLTPSTDDSAVSHSINARLEAVLGSLEGAGGKADLEAISQQVTELLTERRSAFDANLEQVLAATAEADETASISREIRTFLQQELTGSISVLVDQLLRLGWAGLLVQTAVEGEKKAKHLQSYKSVLILLNQALQPGSRNAYLKPEKWQKVQQVLTAGFDAYPLYREQSGSLITQLADCLERGSESYRRYNERRIEMDEGYFDQLLPATLERDIAGAPLPEVDAQAVHQLEQIQVGDWVAEQRLQGHVRMLNLALHDAGQRRYLFVDSQGVKALDFRTEKLLQAISAGQISLVEEAGLPMVERAVERALRQSFERLRDESDQDPVTGLINRRAFRRKLDHLLKNSRNTRTHHTLICLDVDKFTLVNELCGTDGGDRFLANLAGIFQSFLRDGSVLSRTGDNEYSILLPQCRLDEGFRTAESLRKAVQNYHFQWAGEQISVTVSIGLTEIADQGELAEGLISAAQSACEEAKREGRNRSRCYQVEGEVYAQKKRLVQSVPLIEKALENDRLELFAQLIQPVFIGDGLSDHHEVLLRRLDDQDQLASPEQFIEAAERYERMQAVDRWVVQRFFSWANSELTVDKVAALGGFSINLSGHSMADDSFIPFLKEQIQHSVVPPGKLAFEITETAMVSQMDQVSALMREIRALGCRFFLDDFGTGYASYSYLKEFPVDVVKIDGIFVKDIHQDEVSYAMVKSITEVAHHMGKLVVAEFVHTEAVLNALRRLEVDYAQGFYIGRPGPLKLLARSQSVI